MLSYWLSITFCDISYLYTWSLQLLIDLILLYSAIMTKAFFASSIGGPPIAMLISTIDDACPLICATPRITG